MASPARLGRWLSRGAAVLAALLASALAPALLFAPFGLANGLALAVFLVALAHALVLGLPLYALALWKRRPTLPALTGFGALAGALPISAFGLLTGFDGMNASADGVPTWVNGVPTAAGLGETIAIGAVLAFFGALGGMAFWAVLKFTTPDAAPLGTRDPPPDPDRRRSWRAPAALSAAVLAVAVLLVGPSALKDRSCHYPGAFAGAPATVLSLQVGRDQWPTVAEELRRFSVEENLSYRDHTELQPGVVDVLGASLCDPRGLQLSVNQQYWFSDPAAGGLEPVIVPIRVAPAGPDWRPLALRLTQRFERRWPGRVQRQDDPAGVAASRSSSTP